MDSVCKRLGHIIIMYKCKKQKKKIKNIAEHPNVLHDVFTRREFSPKLKRAT